MIDENETFLQERSILINMEADVGQKEGNTPVELEAMNAELTRQNEELTAVLQEAKQKLANQQSKHWRGQ